jgi:hypothetical protein
MTSRILDPNFLCASRNAVSTIEYKPQQRVQLDYSCEQFEIHDGAHWRPALVVVAVAVAVAEPSRKQALPSILGRVFKAPKIVVQRPEQGTDEASWVVRAGHARMATCLWLVM